MDSKNINYIYVGSSKSEAVNEELRNMGSVVNYAGNTNLYIALRIKTN